MEDLELFKRLGLALAIGLLMGMERGWHTRGQSGGRRVAGIRTFALIALFGGISGWLVNLAGPLVLGFLFLGFALLITFSHWMAAREDRDYGITTQVAALLAFVLSAAAMLGDMALVAATGVVATALLAVKQKLHGWISRLRGLELTAAIELLIISVVMLPLLPDQGFGPAEALNPYELWWAVVVVAALSFIGYFALRIAGADLGVMITGLLGGLASSTAMTLSLSRMARASQSMQSLLAVGIVLAGSMTFLRILVVASVFNRSLLPALAMPLGLMAGVGFAGALILRLTAARANGKQADVDQIANPLELGMALKFGVFLALVVLATSYFEQWFGTGGIYAVAALSGINDVDAITISMARMSNGDMALTAAGTAIVIAASVNTAVKGGIALIVGGWRTGLSVGVVYLAVLAAGAGAIWLI